MSSDSGGKRKRSENAQSSGYHTPQPKRLAGPGTSCPTRAKEAAENADPGKGACLLSRRPRVKCHTCHVVPRKTTQAIKDSLTKAWGLGARGLNIHTRYNLLFRECIPRIEVVYETKQPIVTPDNHDDFDKNLWLLFPRPGVINDLVAAYKETDALDKNITSIYNVTDEFEYVMVPREDIMTITRRKLDGSGVENLEYPYLDLGVLKSHVHPHFVIVDTAEKIQLAREAYTKNIEKALAHYFGTSEQDARKLVGDVVNLLDKWIPKAVRPSDSSSADDSEFQPEDDGEDSGGNDPADQSASREDGNQPAKRQTLRSDARQMGNAPPADHSNEAVDDVPELVHTNSTSAATSRGNHYGQSATGSQDDHVSALRPALAGRTPDLSLLDVESDAEWLERIGCWLALSNACRHEYEALDERVDETLVAYRDEPVLKPRTRSWHSWKPKWNYINPKDDLGQEAARRRFSSNDWAVWRNGFVLTDPCEEVEEDGSL